MTQEPTQNNDRTLQSYQNQTERYVEGTPAGDSALQEWTDSCLELIPADGTILEIGSGFGRDAEYIRQRGFTIECSDAVPNFITILKQKGFKARMLNVLTDPIDGLYNMVFADGVLLHFTPEEAARVTRKIHDALRDNGIFALRVKKGHGAEWTDAKLGEPRYFYYWQPAELKQMLEACGFEWVAMSENHTSHNNADWMGVIVKKSLT